MHWAREVFSAEELSGVLASTSICFDLSVYGVCAVVLGREGDCVWQCAGTAGYSSARGSEIGEYRAVCDAGVGAQPGSAAFGSYRQPGRRGVDCESGKAGVWNRKCEAAIEFIGPSEDTTYSTFTFEEGRV